MCPRLEIGASSLHLSLYVCLKWEFNSSVLATSDVWFIFTAIWWQFWWDGRKVLFVDKKSCVWRYAAETWQFVFSNRMRSVLTSMQNFKIVIKSPFKLLLNHSKRGHYQTGNIKPRKVFIGCSIPVITTLTSNLRIITKGLNFWAV